MGNENDETRENARRRLLQDLDDDFTAALSDPAHDIVERVRNGTLSRAKAEDWAREQGRAPFVGKPDPATFRPREKRYWTLAQMAAWAIWRTDDAVRGVSEEYVSRCVEWVEVRRARVRFVSPSEFEFTSPTDRVGYELGSPRVATAYDVIEGARHRVLLGGGSAPMLSPERAQHEILDALQAGNPLVARHGEGEAIGRLLWDGLLSFDPGDGPHDAVSYPSGKMMRFHRVRVERDAVLAVWPVIGIDPVDVREVKPEATGEIVERAVLAAPLSRQEQINAAAADLPCGLLLDVRRKGEKRRSPFHEALVASFGTLHRSESRIAWDHYPHNRGPGRPENAAGNAAEL